MYNANKIIKLIFIITFIIGLIGKYVIHNEVVSDVTFIIISLLFAYFLFKKG